MSLQSLKLNRLGVVLGTALALTLSSATLLADHFFAHGAVGQGFLGFRTELVIASNQIDAISLIKRFRRVQGEVRFVRADGQEMQLFVTGRIVLDPMVGPQDVVNHLVDGGFQYDVLGPEEFTLQFVPPPDVPPDALLSEVFWTQVVETNGATSASLKFVLIQNDTVASVADVPPAVPREYHGLFAVGSLEETPQRRSGIAIANPLNVQANYMATAFDEEFNAVATCSFSLAAQGQRALFINEFGLPTSGVECEDNGGESTVLGDFQGYVQIQSDQLSVSAALLQSSQTNPLIITISSLPTLGADAAPAGPVLSAQLGSLGVDGVDGRRGGLQRPRLTPRGSVQTPVVTLSNSSGDVIEGVLNNEGGLLIGPVPDGTWTLNLDFPGFLPLEQTLEFPSPPLNIRLIPLSVINPVWFEATLGGSQAPGRVIKPSRQFDFIFDTGSFNRADGPEEVDRILRIQEAFKQWVFFELPGLGMMVNDGKGGLVRFGGRSQYSERNFNQAPQGVQQNAIIVSANRMEFAINRNSLVDDDTFELAGTTLLFHPGTAMSQICQPEQDNLCDVPRIVTAFFYSAVFLRQSNLIDPDFVPFALTGLPGEDELLSSTYSQFVANPLNFTATGLDNLYLRVLINRPAGTLITAQGEILPSAAGASLRRGGQLTTFRATFPPSPPQ
ncbi:MAG TPA: hypothetical protein VLU25_00260 [Acidobacteriota bacterium]|nr:hypothetical protein [Acidobacteriota bacterium]